MRIAELEDMWLGKLAAVRQNPEALALSKTRETRLHVVLLSTAVDGYPALQQPKASRSTPANQRPEIRPPNVH